MILALAAATATIATTVEALAAVESEFIHGVILLLGTSLHILHRLSSPHLNASLLTSPIIATKNLPSFSELSSFHWRTIIALTFLRQYPLVASPHSV